MPSFDWDMDWNQDDLDLYLPPKVDCSENIDVADDDDDTARNAKRAKTAHRDQRLEEREQRM